MKTWFKMFWPSAQRAALVAAITGITPGCATQNFTVDSARIAAGKGDPKAQYFLGHLYEKGKGVTQDYALAAGYLRQSAVQGCAEAQNDLGACYARVPSARVRNLVFGFR